MIVRPAPRPFTLHQGALALASNLGCLDIHSPHTPFRWHKSASERQTIAGALGKSKDATGFFLLITERDTIF